MLWLGLLQRDTGVPASQHLQIKDEVVALDFNLAVTLRLLRFDNEREVANQKNLAIRIGNAMARGMGFGDEEPEEDVLGDELLTSDKYADSTTQVW